MSFSQTYARWFKRVLPSPFSLALILTGISILIALLFSKQSPSQLLLSWQDGLWDSALLTFAFQMMMMLVLGHVLALSNSVNRLINRLIKPVQSTAQAALVVCLSTLIVAYLNWGLGLIFGAIMARKMGEHFSAMNKALNYPLIGACGYVGLMVWHGGISGSSLVKVAEEGHLRAIGSNPELPLSIGFDATVFSSMNIIAAVAILIMVPLLARRLAMRSKSDYIPLFKEIKHEQEKQEVIIGAERLDHHGLISKIIGVLLLILAVYIAIRQGGSKLGFITPNYINFSLLGLGLLLHKNVNSFLHAVEDAMAGAAGILIQFPLYFGILALLKAGGLIELFSSFFIAISSPESFPIFTFISAGLVNIFVPSGGGQWAIQGPIILEAATQIGVPLNKAIMALAYGDQITNMLQPFWALPLLSITQLKARQILPYTLLFMLLGSAIFIAALLIF